MKETTCCFSGHRSLPQNELPEIKKRLNAEILLLINKGYTTFCAGGALGFDTEAARAVLAAKETFPHIKLFMFLPCVDQAKYWSKADQTEYARINRLADEVFYSAYKYRNGCMHERNRHLVDESSVCICCFTQKDGGTAYTVNYAIKQELRIINISK